MPLFFGHCKQAKQSFAIPAMTTMEWAQVNLVNAN